MIPMVPPDRRRLRVFAFDPLASHAPNSMLGSAAENEVVLEVEYEPLEQGPSGRRVVVIDHDATRGVRYEPVQLDHPALLAQDGLAPSEDDPRFHQQMAYAVTMKTIENFDRALGRRIRFKRPGKPFSGLGARLGIFPHAFDQKNAFFDPGANAVLFGYFTAVARPGAPFVPGQTVFTCLSADILAHEVTHGLIHRLRPAFMENTNPDVGGFHEGFADIVAIFQHFTYPDLLRKVIQRTNGALDQPGLFVDLAQQFGHGRGDGGALRTAILAPEPTMYEETTEVHDRGNILVAAVFEAFFHAYRQRVSDLVPPGASNLSASVVRRVAEDAESTAQQFLTMCIRAFEYLPPADIRFGDFLRAAITADMDLNGSSTRRNRELLVDGFRRRGIYPDGAYSLSETSLRWPSAEDLGLPNLPNEIAKELLFMASRIERGEEPDDWRRGYAAALQNYGKSYATALGLDPKLSVSAPSFHTSFRVGPDGQLRAEIVVRFEQQEREEKGEGGVLPRGGVTLVANAEGKIRYAIAAPLPGVERADLAEDAARREDRFRRFVSASRDRDPASEWMTEEQYANRMKMRLAAVHLSRGSRA
ncbi:MAG: hypothetical protein U0414_19165 [Polyangiaceae bacterium]